MSAKLYSVVWPADHSVSAPDNDQATFSNTKSMCFHPILHNLKRAIWQSSEVIHLIWNYVFFLFKRRIEENVCTVTRCSMSFTDAFLRQSFLESICSFLYFISGKNSKWNVHKCCRNGDHTTTFKSMFQVLNGATGQKRPSAALKFEHGNLLWENIWSIVLLPVVCV